MSAEFLKAIEIFLLKPHVLDKRCCGSKILLRKITYPCDDCYSIIFNDSSINNLNEIFGDCNVRDSIAGLIDDRPIHERNEKVNRPNIVQGECLDAHSKATVKGLVSSCWKSAKIDSIVSILDRAEVCLCGCTETKNQMEIIVREILPKKINRFSKSVEIIFMVTNSCKVTFFSGFQLANDLMWYQLSLDGKTNEVKVESSADDVDVHFGQQVVLDHRETCGQPLAPLVFSSTWLRQILQPSISKWMLHGVKNTTNHSLSAISIEKYNVNYQRLKEKYGRRLVEVWPESTDPKKFVYEDIAIASYLLTLWQDEEPEPSVMKKQSFIDLGCGNGLLVHILSSEGHCGVGLDVQKRKIWDFYGKETILKEEAINPGPDSLYPQFDWIIGNHSDELTPWIPYIAAKSRHDTKFFVIPCCPFDFTGKFNERSDQLSVYQSFLKFIEKVGSECGFVVTRDTLRIPSTKKVCLFGSKRTYKRHEEAAADARRVQYMTMRCERLKKHYQATQSKKGIIEEKASCDEGEREKVTDGVWSKDFSARKKTEGTRNCISLDSSFKEGIVSAVFSKVLSSASNVENSPLWNAGGSVSLSEIVKLFCKEDLKVMKNECGGIKTLLRNYNNVFRVQSGFVSLRDLRECRTSSYKHSKKPKFGVEKRKLCYFHQHHPQGCPLEAPACSYAHGLCDVNKLM